MRRSVSKRWWPVAYHPFSRRVALASEAHFAPTSMGWPRSCVGAVDVRTVVLMTLAVLPCAMLLGTMVAIGLWRQALLVFVPVSVLCGALFVPTERWKQRTFAFIVVLSLFQFPVASITNIPIGYAIEGLLLAGIVPIGLSVLKACRDRQFRWIVAMYLVFVALALVSSWQGKSSAIAGIWQFQYNAKWLLMLGAGLLFPWKARDLDFILKCFRIALLWIVPAVVLEMFFTSIYTSLLGVNEVRQANPLLLGVIAKLRGPFPHSGYLSMFSCFASVGFLLAAQRQGWRMHVWPFVGYFSLLMIAGQRQEFFGWLIAVWILLTLNQPAGQRMFAMVVSGLLGVVALIALYMIHPGPFLEIIAQWGGSPFSSLSERGLLTQAGVELGNRYFPLGAGLGTYGGAGAQKFDLSVFWEMGFGTYWWFREGKFLVDTYWPNFIAESGWIGAAAMLASFLAVCRLLVRAAMPVMDRINDVSGARFALAGLLLLLLNTPTSGMISDARGAYLIWFVVGAVIASRVSLPEKTA